MFRKHRGVYALGRPDISIKGVFLAAILAIGADAVLSHLAAGSLFGIWRYWRPGQPVDVSVPRDLRSRPGIRVHSTARLLPQDTTTHEGIRVVTAARAVLDLAAVVYSDRAFRRAVHEAQVQDLVTHEQLQDQIVRNPGPAATRLARLITPGPIRTRSGDEDEVVDMLLRNGFPTPRTNTPIEGLPSWIEVDIYFPEERVVIEVDSVFHDTRIRREDDADRQAIMDAHGVRVLRLRKEDALAHERDTVAYVRRGLLQLG